MQMTVEILQVLLLHRFLTCPLWCNVMHSSCVQVVDICGGADADSFGPSLQKIIEILQLQFIDKVVDVCSCAVVEETAELPQLRRFAWTLALHMPVVVQRQLPGGSDGRKLRRSRSCSTSSRDRCPCCAGSSGFVKSLDKVVDMPVIVNDSGVAHSRGASDSVHRQTPWTLLLWNKRRERIFQQWRYGGGEGILSGVSAFFALLRVVPELSASLRSPRRRRVLRCRGPLHHFMLRVC